MFNTSTIEIIKKSCVFTLEIIDFYDELTLTGKKPIAIRVLSSTLYGITSLQKALHATKNREFNESKTQAVRHFKNVAYWIEQCEKSGYWFDEILLRNALEILEFCNSKEFAV